MSNPWEHQTDWEERPRYAWFREFLTLDHPRRLILLARRPGCPWTWPELEDIARDDGWRERAAAWDEHLERITQAEIERITAETAQQVATRHGRVWGRLMRVAESEVGKLERDSRNRETPVLTPRELIRALDRGTHNERLIRGEATEQVAVDLDWSKLSDQEQEMFRALAEKLESR